MNGKICWGTLAGLFWIAFVVLSVTFCKLGLPFTEADGNAYKHIIIYIDQPKYEQILEDGKLTNWDYNLALKWQKNKDEKSKQEHHRKRALRFKK